LSKPKKVQEIPENIHERFISQEILQRLTLAKAQKMANKPFKVGDRIYIIEIVPTPAFVAGLQNNINKKMSSSLCLRPRSENIHPKFHQLSDNSYIKLTRIRPNSIVCNLIYYLKKFFFKSRKYLINVQNL
jgi:hypothetical protein